MSKADNLTKVDLGIIHTRGSLDFAYPPFILASTAATLGKSVSVFFTFYGLKCLLKDLSNLKVSPVGNPAMKMTSPIGPNWLKNIDWRILPDFVWTLPGATSLATLAFKKQMQLKGQLPIEEMRDICLEQGVNLIACQMTVDLFGYKENDFVDGVKFAGATSYLTTTAEQQSLFI